MSKKKVRKKQVSNKKTEKKSFMPVIWLVIGIALLMSAVYVNYYRPGKIAEIKIVATTQKNDEALGDNVRISTIMLTDNEDRYTYYELKDAVNDEGWNFDEENTLLTCYEATEACESVITVENKKSALITFISERGSGIAEVYVNGKLKKSVDLYSDSDWDEIPCELDINYTMFYVYNVAVVVLALVGLFVLLYLCIYKNRKRLLTALKNFNIAKAVFSGVTFVLLYVLVLSLCNGWLFSKIKRNEILLTITATAQQNENALADNVRISEMDVNDSGESFDFTKFDLENGWQYDGVEHFMYVYNPVEPASASILLNNVRTIDIQYVKEIGSGIVEFKINGRVIKSVDLYEDTTWDNGMFHYAVSPLLNVTDVGVLVLVFVFGALLCIFTYDTEYGKVVFNYVGFVGGSLIFALALNFLVPFVQRDSINEALVWISENSLNFLKSYCILALLTFFIASLFNKNYAAYITVSVVVMLMLATNYFKLNIRNMPLFPWDFAVAGAAASVVSKYKLVPSTSIVVGAVAIVIVLIVLGIYFKKHKGHRIGIKLRVGSCVVTAVVLVLYVANTAFTASVNLFSAKDYYMDEGFVLAFTETMQYLKSIEQPEGYSEETMQAIYDKIENTEFDETTKKPNIILIMSESFWDMTRVEELDFGEEMFPTYRNLQKTSVTGELLTNVFGGGTVNSEFEAMTGFSVSYLPTEYMPYQRCMRDGMFSINSFLENEGYYSLAIHPFDKSNYNRNQAYESFGFDKTVWEEDFDEDADRMRGYISDSELVKRIISEYEQHNEESDSPFFNLSVSMQNHGGYWESSIDEGKNVDVDVSSFEESSQGSIKDMAIGLHYADLALGELIDYFKTVDEPTLIIMFGDHMSDAGPIGSRMLEQSALVGGTSSSGRSTADLQASSVYEQRRVPFMAWSNEGNTKKDCGVLSVTQLLPTIFSEYDVAMPKYFSYLKYTQSVYPACASGIIVNTDGSFNSIDEMTDEQKEVYDEQELMEYDYLFGKNYIEKLYEQ